jgi:ornithine cyclodeaminase/alanine dehydrogenase-like protein (mu-crystallin family)
MRVLDAAATRAALSPNQATMAIREALAGGLDPATDPARQSMPVPGGELLMMPSALTGAVGIKVLTVAEHAAGAELPRVQGQYLLFDATTLTPRLILDGAALTVVRTPAVSFAPFLPRLATLASPVRVAIFGTGPQALAHHATLRELLPSTTELQVSYLSRTAPAEQTDWLDSTSATGRDAVRTAQLIVCATTAREPILDRPEVRSDAIVIAVGSHTPGARELGSALLADADVLVEDRATALRECGDVVLAVADGSLDPGDLIPLREVVLGRALSAGRPAVFKTSGMSWEDLVIAQAIAGAVTPH